jgi:peptidoglycan/xylan/chitin deacetylase (PgdA/CDA1 family)
MFVALERILLHLCRCAGLFHLARWLTRGQLRILAHHGFSLDDESDWRPTLFMPIESFRRRLDWLQRHFAVVALNDGLKKIGKKGLSKPSVVITVDDGFADFHRLAAPLLKTRRLPATVYVTTYYVVHQSPVFRLTVQYMFWKTGRDRIDLATLATSLTGTVDLSDPQGKEETAWSIIRHGEESCTQPQREGLLRRLGSQLGVRYEAIAASRKFSLMTEEEIEELAKQGFDFQLHSHRHRMSENPDQIVGEIRDNRAVLADLVRGPLEHFCYPSGEWSEQMWHALKHAGIRSAATCSPGLNSAQTPPGALLRITDSANLSQIEFEAEISGLLPWIRRLRDGSRRLLHRQPRPMPPQPNP